VDRCSKVGNRPPTDADPPGAYVSLLQTMLVDLGYRVDDDRWWWNNRVKSFRLDFSQGAGEDYTVEDSREWQEIELDTPRRTDFVKFTILSVYPYEEYDDTSISELHVYGTK
jgi:hypothetical protein